MNVSNVGAASDEPSLEGCFANSLAQMYLERQEELQENSEKNHQVAPEPHNNAA